ncbi:MAG: hypothetical protein H0V12_02470 [Chloroflexi bacterium]|nr:hypothetical protein [Chloroflexota bacterium]
MTYFTVGSGREQRWGPDDQWGMWLGSGVIHGLLDLLDQFLAAPSELGRRYDPVPAALGCVPWITHGGIIDRLIGMPTCIVISKPSKSGKALTRLAEEGAGFPSIAIPDFEGYAPRGTDGQPTVVGPDHPWPPGDSHVGPVRVTGFMGKNVPLLHAKLLVLGDLSWQEDDFSMEMEAFRPRVVWWGSANWTQFAEQHIEMATWSSDAGILQRATRFLSDVVKISEPLGSTSERPQPEYAPVEYDDDEFYEYLQEHGQPPPDEFYDGPPDPSEAAGLDRWGEYGFLSEESDEDDER